MKKVIHIVGPTAVGKTKLAVFLAKEFDGTLVSADSIQAYKGLDIVSGKDLPKGSQFNLLHRGKNGVSVGYYLFDNIRIFLLDVVDSSFSFNSFIFQEIAKGVIKDIFSQNKQPIVVGGTGLYVQSLINKNIFTASPSQQKLRKGLEELSVAQLQEKVRVISKELYHSLNNSDKNNPRRLVRIIENKGSLGKVLQPFSRDGHIIIGLECDREELKKRIDKRVDERINDGALEEAKKLFETYSQLSPQIKSANGYKHLFSFLNGEINWDECLYRWKVSEYRHAKNQMTWFKKYSMATWFDIEEEDYQSSIVKVIKNHLVESYSD